MKTDGTAVCWEKNDDGQAPCLTISPVNLPNGTAGLPYNQRLSASGGSAPYTFAAVAGNLPPGLSLSTGGTLSGTPTSVGTYTSTAQATDSLSLPFSARQGTTVTVDEAQRVYLPVIANSY